MLNNANLRQLLTFNSTSSVSFVLPLAQTLTPNFYCFFENLGVGAVTFTTTSGTIDGGSSLVLQQNQGIILFSNSTNWFTVRGMPSSAIPTGPAGGDLGGTYPNPSVNKIRGFLVSANAPSDGNALKWVASNSDWEPGAGGGGVNAQTGTTYTIAASDNEKLVTFNNVAAVAITVPAASSVGALFFCLVENLGAGLVTLTPATGTIDGAASVSIAQNQGLSLYSNGTNWFTVRGLANLSGIAGGVNLQTGTAYTVVAADNGKIVSITNAAAMTITVTSAATLGASFWCAIENRGAGALTVTPAVGTIDGAANLAVAANNGVVIYSDGTNIYTMRGISGGGGGMTNPMTAAGDMIAGGVGGAPVRVPGPAGNEGVLITHNNVPAFFTQLQRTPSGANLWFSNTKVGFLRNSPIADVDINSLDFRSNGMVAAAADTNFNASISLLSVASVVTPNNGNTYLFRFSGYANLDATGGIRLTVDIPAASMNWAIWHVLIINDATGAIVLSSRQTALGAVVTYVGATSVRIEITGSMSVLSNPNPSGFAVRAAQSVASGTTTVLRGSQLVMFMSQ